MALFLFSSILVRPAVRIVSPFCVYAFWRRLRISLILIGSSFHSISSILKFIIHKITPAYSVRLSFLRKKIPCCFPQGASIYKEFNIYPHKGLFTIKTDDTIKNPLFGLHFILCLPVRCTQTGHCNKSNPPATPPGIAMCEMAYSQKPVLILKLTHRYR